MEDMKEPYEHYYDKYEHSKSDIDKSDEAFAEKEDLYWEDMD